MATDFESMVNGQVIIPVPKGAAPPMKQFPMEGGPRRNIMPPIPEEEMLNLESVDPARRARELLKFALGGEDEDDRTDGEDHASAKAVNGNDLVDSSREQIKKDNFVLVVEDPLNSQPQSKKKSKRGGSRVHVFSEQEMELVDIEANFQQPVVLSAAAANARPRIAIASSSQPSNVLNIPQSQFVSLDVFRMTIAMFALVNLEILGALLVAGLLTSGAAGYAILGVGGGLWLLMLVHNVYMGSKPTQVLQMFLKQRKKALLGRASGKGQLVVVKGTVAQQHGRFLSSELGNATDCVVIDTRTRSCPIEGKQAGKWREDARYLRAVDFRIIDERTGSYAIVQAAKAARENCLVPLIQDCSSMPVIKGGRPPVIVESIEEEGNIHVMTAAVETTNSQCEICEGCVRVGQQITLMGLLQDGPTPGSLYIEPLTIPHNISKLMLLWHVIPVPFFYPTWIAGLVILDGLRNS